jgi:hypothetical protein
MTAACTEYAELPGLSGYYFEDSYVLGIEEKLNELTFRLDVVLTKEHAYRWTAKPRPIRPGRLWGGKSLQ